MSSRRQNGCSFCEGNTQKCIIQSIFTARKRSCGKVILSQVSVCPQGGRALRPPGPYLPDGFCNKYGGRAGGTHPTRMLSCVVFVSQNESNAPIWRFCCVILKLIQNCIYRPRIYMEQSLVQVRWNTQTTTCMLWKMRRLTSKYKSLFAPKIIDSNV